MAQEDADDSLAFPDSEQPQEEDFSVAETRSELERLRAKNEPTKPVGSSDLCPLPADVMELPTGIQISEEMRTLLDKLTAPDSKPRLGFCEPWQNQPDIHVLTQCPFGRRHGWGRQDNDQQLARAPGQLQVEV